MYVFFGRGGKNMLNKSQFRKISARFLLVGLHHIQLCLSRVSSLIFTGIYIVYFWPIACCLMQETAKIEDETS